ncbi:MAG: hypothetical protein M1436_09210 [Acidobacteria bacterium]|nr:hypothetical protein [Acidobacteriota bacterium]
MMTEAEVITGLQQFSDRIGRLMELVGSEIPASKEQIAQAQHLLKAIKADLEAEVRPRMTTRGRSAMSEVEAACYYPALQEALSKIRVHSNSRPGRGWYSGLDDAQDLIDTSLSGLLNPIKGRSD